MMAAHPSGRGYLLLPTILLYFGVLSAVGWIMDYAAHLLLDHAPLLNGAVFTVLDQYLSFFALTQVPPSPHMHIYYAVGCP